MSKVAKFGSHLMALELVFAMGKVFLSFWRRDGFEGFWRVSSWVVSCFGKCPRKKEGLGMFVGVGTMLPPVFGLGSAGT